MINIKSYNNVFKYLSIGYVATFSNILLNFMMIKLLDTTSIGRISLGKSIFQSYEISHFGIKYGLDRYLPHSRTDEECSKIFSIGLFSSLFFSFCFTLFWFFFTFKEIWFYSLFYLSGIIYCLISIYRIFYRAKEDKKDFVRLSLSSNILPPVFQIIGLFLGGSFGLVLGLFISYLLLIYITYGWFRVKIIFPVKEGRKLFNQLFKSGYLLFITSLISYFSISGDRFFIAHYWGLERLGLFSVIMFFFSVFNIFAVNYTEMIMNRIVLHHSFRYIVKQVVILTFFTLILVCITYLLIPIFVNLFIPQYRSDIGLMRLILLAAIPFSALPVLNQFMHAIDKRDTLLYINILSNLIYYIALIHILRHTTAIYNILLLKIGFHLALTTGTFIFSFYYRKIKPIH